MPPRTQTSPKSDVHPTSAIIGAGVLNIPEPMIRLITIAVDSLRPRFFWYSVTKAVYIKMILHM